MPNDVSISPEGPRAPSGSATALLFMIVLGSMLFGGCGEGSSGEAPAAVEGAETDSSGVAIIQYPAGVRERLPRWTLSDSASLVIGKVEGEAPYLFGSLHSALRMPDGRFVVLDRQGWALRVFGPDGTFEREFGGQGEEPGAFRGVDILARLPHGRVALNDRILDRVSYFDLANGLDSIVSRPCGSAEAGCRVGGLVGGGSVLLTWPVGSRPAGMDRGEVMRHGGGRHVLARDAGGRHDVFDSVAATEMASFMTEGTSLFVWRTPELFARAGLWASGPGGVAVAAADRFEIRMRDTTGVLRQIVRLEDGPEPVDPDAIASARAFAEAHESENLRTVTLAYLDALEPPATVPFYSDLRMGADGRAWVADYAPPDDFASRDVRRWTIFAADGRPLATMETGPAEDILDMGKDWMLLRTTDELDVERVALYPIVPGG